MDLIILLKISNTIVTTTMTIVIVIDIHTSMYIHASEKYNKQNINHTHQIIHELHN